MACVAVGQRPSLLKRLPRRAYQDISPPIMSMTPPPAKERKLGDKRRCFEEAEEAMPTPPPPAKMRRLAEDALSALGKEKISLATLLSMGNEEDGSLLLKRRQLEVMEVSAALRALPKLPRKRPPSPPPSPEEPVPVEAAPSLLERADAACRPQQQRGKMLCREDEWNDVSKHLRSALLEGGTSQVLYLSGMPGTGKTALVLEVLQQLKRERRTIGDFLTVHVNAMQIGCPQAIFSAILQQLGLRQKGASVSSGVARAELTNLLSQRSATAPPIVLLVDEVDHLVTPNQAVLYNLFDWLGLPHPGLVFVAISNTMDLPERLLPRVASRFGFVRIDFQPYGKQELATILQERLRSQDAEAAMGDMTVRMVAAKVAAGSGDLRKALQLCRHACEVCSRRTNGQGPVSIADIEVAEKDILHANPVAQAVGGLGPRARRFLVAVAVEMRKQPQANAVSFQKVSCRFAKLNVALQEADTVESREALFRMEESMHLLKRLEAMSVLVMRHGAVKDESDRGIVPVILLGAGLDIEDLSRALLQVEEDEGVRSILENEQLLPIAP